MAITEVIAEHAQPVAYSTRAGAFGLRLKPSYPRAVAAAVVGLALLVVALGVMTDGNMSKRVLLSLLGVGALYLAFDQAGARTFGPRFETGFVLSVAWIAIIVLAGVFADWLPLAESTNASRAIGEPILARPDLFSEHPLGTDRQGLDILGGVIYGARLSLIISVGAVVIGTIVGGLIGMLAGFHRGKLDGGVSLLTDTVLAFPELILLLGMVAVLQPSVRNVTIALAILVIPVYVRLARANTLVFMQREFVTAARALGARNWRVMFFELLTNVMVPVISYGFIIVAGLIVAESSLSYLGLSVQRPTPTLGNMIAAGQADFRRHPHLVFVAGTALFITVLAMNRIGDHVNRKLGVNRSRALGA